MTPLQVACYGQDAISAHLTVADLYPCDESGGKCFPRYVHATLVVDEVMAPSGGLKVGDTLDASFSVTSPLDQDHADEPTGAIGLPLVVKITDELVKSQLVGHRLFFSVASKARSLMSGLPAGVDAPFYAQAYAANRGDWLREVWASPDCAKERADAEVIRRKLGRFR